MQQFCDFFRLPSLPVMKQHRNTVDLVQRSQRFFQFQIVRILHRRWFIFLHRCKVLTLPPDVIAVVDQNSCQPGFEISVLSECTDPFPAIKNRLLNRIRGIFIIHQYGDRDAVHILHVLLHQGCKCIRIPVFCLSY